MSNYGLDFETGLYSYDYECTGVCGNVLEKVDINMSGEKGRRKRQELGWTQCDDCCNFYCKNCTKKHLTFVIKPNWSGQQCDECKEVDEQLGETYDE